MHKFDPAKAHKLDSEERHKLLPPEETLIKLGLVKETLAADIGCGTGFFTIAASKILGDDGKIYAFDTEKKMLTLLRMKIEKSNIVPIISEENKLPLKDKLLDFALIAFVLHEAHNAKDFLAEAKRVLKNNGLLAIIEWIKQEEEKGPPKKERLDKNLVSNLLEELNFKVQFKDKLNDSHYAVVGCVNH